MSELINIGPINAGAGLDFEGWTCPLPLRDSPNIVMGHGGGGQMSAELIDHLFIPALGGQPGAQADGGRAAAALGGDAFHRTPGHAKSHHDRRARHHAP